MFMYQTREMIEAARVAHVHHFEAALERARQRQEALDAWQKAHPPCPRCGHAEPPPVSYQLG
jgi:hypothetical protein